jgi:dTMP kinase
MTSKNIRKKKKTAFFISFEGLEGSGKSSVIAYLVRHLRKQGLSVKTFREPGSTTVGEKIRSLLLDKKNKISDHTELLLYLAARTQLIEEKLLAALGSYDIVICDRFYDSTVVYQGYGLGMGRCAWDTARTFSLGIKPHLTLVLDSDVKTALKRLNTKDRIEARPFTFHYRLRQGYRQIAKREPSRIKLIDGNQTLPCVCEQIKDLVTTSLKKWSSKRKF